MSSDETSLVQATRQTLVNQLATLSTDSPKEQVLDVYDRVCLLKSLAKELAQMADAAMVEWIKANGEIEVGDLRYYVGKSKDTKCKDVRRTMESALNATGGDVDALVGLLSSGAWKPGACRQVLPPEEYAECFHTVEVEDVKTGKPKVGLQKVNTAFIK